MIIIDTYALTNREHFWKGAAWRPEKNDQNIKICCTFMLYACRQADI